MHTKEKRYFRTEAEAQVFADRLKNGPANEVYVRLGPVLATNVVYQDTQTPAWVVEYEEYT